MPPFSTDFPPGAWRSVEGSGLQTCIGNRMVFRELEGLMEDVEGFRDVLGEYIKARADRDGFFQLIAPNLPYPRGQPEKNA